MMRPPAIRLLIASMAVTTVHAQPAAPLPTLSLGEQRVYEPGPIGWVPIDRVALSRTERLAVLQQQDGRILLFDSTGAWRAVAGKHGSGPGEFRVVASMGWSADSLWIYDPTLLRLSLFDVNGRLIRTQPLSSLRDSRALSRIARNRPFTSRVESLLGDGSLVVQLAYHGPAMGQRELVRVPRSGGAAVLLAAVPIERGTIVFKTRAGDGSTSAPFAWSAIIFASSVGDAAGYVEQTHDQSGQTTVSVHRALTATNEKRVHAFTARAEAIPRAVRDSAVGAAIASSKGSGRAVGVGGVSGQARLNHPPEVMAMIEREIASRAGTHHRPFIRALFGNDARLWLLRRSADARATEYVVVGGTSPGDEAAIHLPPRSTLVAATSERVWVVTLDEDDLPTLTRYRVRR